MNSIIVTGANGDIGLSIGRILKESMDDFKIFGTDCNGEWPAKDIYDDIYYLPNANEKGYIKNLKKLVAVINPKLVICVTEPELKKISNENNFCTKKFIVNENFLLNTFLDKLSTYHWLKDNNTDAPLTVDIHEVKSNQFPVFVKSRYGHGNQNYELVRDMNRLDHYKTNSRNNYVAQEYIPFTDNEYTCAIIKINKKVNHLIMKRKLEGSNTVKIEVVENKHISDSLHKISNAINHDFFINVQLRLDSDAPKIFEINPRFSGTSMMRHKIGFQDVLWMVKKKLDVLNELPNCKIHSGIQVFRAFDEIIKK